MNYRKTTGELQEREFILDWKIPNFSSSFSSPLYSPSFTFAGMSWHLFLDTGAYINCVECFEVAFVQESSGPPKSLTYSFALKTNEGGKVCERLYSHVFEPFMKPNFHNLVSMSEFLRMKTELLPSNILTIQFRVKLSKSTSDSGSECISQHATAALSRNVALLDFKEFFLSQEHCDVTLKVKEQEFRAHKAVLCARSSVFSATFRHDMKEKATGTVDIEDCDPACFRDFMCYLYCADVEILSSENVFGLFIAADKYDVQELRSQCLGFMIRNLSADTFCDSLTLALQYSEREVTDLLVDFFSRHLIEVIQTPEWQSFRLKNTIAGDEIFTKALVCQSKRAIVRMTGGERR